MTPTPKKKGETALAEVVIRGAAAMTERGRAKIATWLRATASTLELDGHNYAPVFRARYMANSLRPEDRRA